MGLTSKEMAEALIEKAGEGSRGGHIIGHTSKGNPIYGSKAEKQRRADKTSNAQAAKNFDGYKQRKEIKAKLDSGKEHKLSNGDYLTKEGNFYNLHSGGHIVQKKTIFDSIMKFVKEPKKDTIRKSVQMAEALMKAGEGSRGGHIIGHTKGGNPIYGAKADKKKDMNADDNVLAQRVALSEQLKTKQGKDYYFKNKDLAKQGGHKPKKKSPSSGRVYGKQRDELEWKLSDMKEELKDEKRYLKELFADQEHEAGQKGSEWTDDDANRYGEQMNQHEENIEKLSTKIDKIEDRLAKGEEVEAIDMIIDIIKGNKLEGGLGDKTKVKDVDAAQLKMGMKVEMEHTNDSETAKEIALDHLTEDPKYYTKLKEVEKGCDKNKAELTKALDNIFEKAVGKEGSRGGNIIGHTKSGDPIYGKKGTTAHEVTPAKAKNSKFKNYTERHLEHLVQKKTFDSRHFEDMNDHELKHLKEHANANIFNSGLNDSTKKRVGEWHRGAISESGRRKRANLNKALDDIFEKAVGEGSKGGHVIGHTKSGNAVYGAKADKKAPMQTADKSGKKGITINGKKVFASDSGLWVNLKKVEIDRKSGYVKMGGKGVDMPKGGLVPAGTGKGQLQGLKYVDAVNMFKTRLQSGKSWKEIDKELTGKGKDGFGVKGGNDHPWEAVKKHLGL